jgi:hypothetical protein
MSGVTRAVLMEIMSAGDLIPDPPPPECALTIVSTSKNGWHVQASTHLFEGDDAGKSVCGDTVPHELRNPPSFLGSVDGFTAAGWPAGEMSVVITTNSNSRGQPLTCIREAGRINNVIIANKNQTLLLLFENRIKVVRGSKELVPWDTEATLNMQLPVIDADMTAERVWAIVGLGENVWAVSAHDLYAGGTSTVGTIPKPRDEYTRRIVGRTKPAACIATKQGTLWVVLTNGEGEVFFGQVSHHLGSGELYIDVPETVDNGVGRVATIIKGHNGTVMLQALHGETLKTSRKGRYMAAVALRSDGHELHYRWISPDQRHATDVEDVAAERFRKNMSELLTGNIFSLGTHGGYVSIVAQTNWGVAMNLFSMTDDPSKHYVMRVTDDEASNTVPVAACVTVGSEAVAALSANLFPEPHRQAARLQDKEMWGVIERKSTDPDDPKFDLNRGLECYRDATEIKATMEALGPMNRGYGAQYVDDVLACAGAWLLSMTKYRTELKNAMRRQRTAEAINDGKDGIIADRDGTIKDHETTIKLLEAKCVALAKRVAALSAVELFNEETAADVAKFEALRAKLAKAEATKLSMQSTQSSERNRHAAELARLKRTHELELAGAVAKTEADAKVAADAAAKHAAALEAEITRLKTAQKQTAKRSGEVRQSKLSKARADGYADAKAELGGAIDGEQLSKARAEARAEGYAAAKAELKSADAVEAGKRFADERRELKVRIAELERTLAAKAAASKWDSSYAELFAECTMHRQRIVELESMLFNTYNHWGLASTQEIEAAFQDRVKLEAERLAGVAKLIDLERNYAGACETIAMLRKKLAAKPAAAAVAAET